MQARAKSRLTRIAGNSSVLLAVIIVLAAMATPDDGPAPSNRVIIMALVFAGIPLLGLGVWLRRCAGRLAEKAEMESCIQELAKPDKPADQERME